MQLSNDKMRQALILVGQRSVSAAEVDRLGKLLGSKQEFVASLLLREPASLGSRELMAALLNTAKRAISGASSTRSSFADPGKLSRSRVAMADQQAAIVENLQNLRAADDVLALGIRRHAQMLAEAGQCSRGASCRASTPAT